MNKMPGQEGACPGGVSFFQLQWLEQLPGLRQNDFSTQRVWKVREAALHSIFEPRPIAALFVMLPQVCSRAGWRNRWLRGLQYR